MTVTITRLTPARSESLPFKATIVTRDDRGNLVGVRVLRAVTEEKLEEELRGYNARNDIATDGTDR